MCLYKRWRNILNFIICYFIYKITYLLDDSLLADSELPINFSFL